jgi:hypothetical protein
MFNGAVNNSRKQRGKPFSPGTSGNPRGRPKGARNKRTSGNLEAAKAGGELPLDYMLRVMRDPKVSNSRRDEMARTAAPYLHPRLAATVATVHSSPQQLEPPRIELVFVPGPGEAPEGGQLSGGAMPFGPDTSQRCESDEIARRIEPVMAEMKLHPSLQGNRP